MTKDNAGAKEFGTLVGQFFQEICPPERSAQAEATVFDEHLWSRIVEMGLPLIGIDEDRGGAGGGVDHLIVALQAQGANAVPAPIAESQLAHWALAVADGQLREDDSVLTVLLPDARNTASIDGSTITGAFLGVPWGRVATRAVGVVADGDGHSLITVDIGDARIEPGLDLAGEPRDVLHFDHAQVGVVSWRYGLDELERRFALSRVAQMAGAIEGVAALTREYVTVREQFGRPIGKFQSVQQHIVHLEQMSTMSALAADRAALALIAGDSSATKLAKQLVNENALIAVRAAHQAHGAMGMTREYRLQLLTRRLNSWLGEGGSSRDLVLRIADEVQSRGLAAAVSAH